MWVLENAKVIKRENAKVVYMINVVFGKYKSYRISVVFFENAKVIKLVWVFEKCKSYEKLCVNQKVQEL